MKVNDAIASESFFTTDTLKVRNRPRSGRDEANGRATALIAFGTGPNIHPW